MREAGRRLGLTQKARADLGPERELGGQELDGHLPLEPPVAGLVDDPHSAAADLAVQRIVLGQHALDARAQLVVSGCGDRIGHRQGGER